VSAPALDLEGLPPFERSVLELLRRIPMGEVRPYSWLAREAGRPAAVRAVGNSMARNPLPLLLPCHRVVPVRGGVGNYAFGSDMKRELLRREGAPLGELDEMVRDGFRFVGCTSTRIYCHPACRDIRRARPDRRERFASSGQAAAAGYRPCRHCRP
jgi:O-6-methylguanine DNA methyltransferase